MRGSPLIHLVLLVTAFALVAVPLRHLTGAGKGDEPSLRAIETEESAEERVPVRLRLRFAHRPEALALESGGRDLLEGVEWGESPVEREIELNLGKDGTEFLLEGRWAEGAPETAVTVELEPDGMDLRTETRWSEGRAISDVLTFEWK